MYFVVAIEIFMEVDTNLMEAAAMLSTKRFGHLVAFQYKMHSFFYLFFFYVFFFLCFFFFGEEKGECRLQEPGSNIISHHYLIEDKRTDPS